MNILQAFGNDATKATQGVWVNYGDAKFKIGKLGFGNPKYKSALTSAQLTGFTEDELPRVRAEILADTIVLGWENVEFNGVAFPYTRENAVMVLSDPNLVAFLDWIESVATKRENYALEVQKENLAELKNV